MFVKTTDELAETQTNLFDFVLMHVTKLHKQILSTFLLQNICFPKFHLSLAVLHFRLEILLNAVFTRFLFRHRYFYSQGVW